MAVLSVSGQDAQRFLNGMLTADIAWACDQAPSFGRSFILTAKGKIISEVHFVSLSKNQIYLQMREVDAAKVCAHLEKFLIADQVKISLEDPSKKGGGPVFSSGGPLAARHPKGLEKLYRAKMEGEKIILPELKEKHSFAEAFAQGLARWGIELREDDFFLEFPLHDSVSFDKGCYIGQESVARGTFRGKVTKVFARFTGKSDLAVGTITNAEGKHVGDIRSCEATHGLGLIRLDSGFVHPSFEKIEPLVNEKTFRGER